MNKRHLLLFLAAGLLVICLSTAGCITSSNITGPVTQTQKPLTEDPIIGTWIGYKPVPNYGDDKYTMVFKSDGTGTVSLDSMGLPLPSNFTWKLLENGDYKLNFAIAASGFMQTNTLVLNSDGKTCTVIGIEFIKS
ncbi:MAG: hypothetical protein PHY67_04825 [Methanocorpusculum sp.]|jgi:predicted small secreted protein|nr:hypothetical protein [Methanocorpusculum sp.]